MFHVSIKSTKGIILLPNPIYGQIHSRESSIYIVLLGHVPVLELIDISPHVSRGVETCVEVVVILRNHVHVVKDHTIRLEI